MKLHISFSVMTKSIEFKKWKFNIFNNNFLIKVKGKQTFTLVLIQIHWNYNKIFK